MTTKRLPPVMGIDNTREEFSLEVSGDNAKLYVRDAVNIDFTESGRIALRQGVDRQTTLPFKYLWQSSLHQDCFAVLHGSWVKVDPNTWEYEELVPQIGESPVFHRVVNNYILMSCDTGLYMFNGLQATKFTMDTPAKPYINRSENGSIDVGEYSFAIAWLVGEQESGLSEIDKVIVGQYSSLDVQFPLCLDDKVTHVRLYMTEQNGSELHQVMDYPISTTQTSLSVLPELGRVAQFQYLSPMKHGKFLSLWRGRILCAQLNVLYFSEAMTFHLTDERYNFIQLPQRITFVEPVDGGIWVGQFDHVVFLRGADLKELVIENKAAAKPIQHTSLTVPSAVVGGDISQGGALSAMWLTEKGFVVGTASGQLIELQSDHLSNITAQSGMAVSLGNRVIAIVN